MIAQSLMSRAREILKKHTGPAAMIIVPLALAVPGRADALFNLGANSVTATLSGGAMGNATFKTTGPGTFSGTQPGTGVNLSGDTVPPSSNTPTPPTPVYLNEGFPGYAALPDVTPDPLVFHWRGGFEPGGMINPLEHLALTYDVNLIGTTDRPAFDPLSWKLTVEVDDASSHPLSYYETSGTGLGNPNTGGLPLDVIISDTGTPDSWDVFLVVPWNFNSHFEVNPLTHNNDLVADHPNDTLSVMSDIDLTFAPGQGLVGGVPTPAVPLPSAGWMGGLMIFGLGAHQMWRRKNSFAGQ